MTDTVVFLDEMRRLYLLATEGVEPNVICIGPQRLGLPMFTIKEDDE